MKNEASRHSVRRRVAIVGPMLGRNKGYVTTQGEFLTDLLREAGVDVVSTSVRPARLRRFMDIAHTLRRELPDVDGLIVETYSGPSFVVEDMASYLGRIYRRPIILHLHGGAMPAFARRFPKWTARLFGRATAIVAPTQFLARELGRYCDRVRVIPNIVELDGSLHRLREHVGPRLFWMRAFHAIYNPLMALRVVARVRATLPEATLAISGQDKGMRGEIEATAESMGLRGAVEVLGFLDESEKRAVAARSDIFINTTHIDNAPVSVVEMCALGLPVVSTNVGGVPDLVTHEETALLVPDNDDRAMADSIIRLVRQPELARRLSLNGPSVAAQCTWAVVGPKWEALFAEVLPLRA